MNASAGIKVDKATFYRFIERQAEGRFEYDRGRIVQHMTGGTFDHAQIVNDLSFVLRSLLARREWVVTGQSRGVDTGETVRYPDVVVERSGALAKGLWTDCPILVLEVLSPSTAELDLNVKPAEYMALPSLLAYVVASQDEPELTVWQRRADATFPQEPSKIRGIDQALGIDALGITIALSDIYQGLAA